MIVPHLEQYAGPFAMEETAFNAVLDYVNSVDLAAHIQRNQKLRQEKPRQDAGDDDDDLGAPLMTMTDDGIALFSVVGSMTKYGSSLSSGPSTIALRKSIRQAANDPKCVGGMMDFDTPGGTADGTEELASEIAAFAAKKPMWGFANGMACSAGYWAYSQCNYCVAAPGAMVGSIGTYGVMYDRSAQFAQNGVKATVIKAGQFKGTGAAGTEITPDQIADQNRVVNQINDLFVSGVAKGRKMTADQAKALNDGRVHVGQNAKALGLVDQIGSFDDAMAGLRAAIATQAKQKKQSAPGALSGAKLKGAPMSEQNVAPGEQQASAAPATPTAPAAASLKDLKSKFPKSTADWREKCQEDSLTIAQASERWMAHLEEQNARLDEDLKQAKATKVGTKPLATATERDAGKDAGNEADPKAQLNAIAADYQKSGMSREKAFSRACTENPELREAWCQSHTQQHAQKVKSGLNVR